MPSGSEIVVFLQRCGSWEATYAVVDGAVPVHIQTSLRGYSVYKSVVKIREHMRLLLAAGKEELTLESHHAESVQESHILEPGTVVRTYNPSTGETHPSWAGMNACAENYTSNRWEAHFIGWNTGSTCFLFSLCYKVPPVTPWTWRPMLRILVIISWPILDTIPLVSHSQFLSRTCLT